MSSDAIVGPAGRREPARRRGDGRRVSELSTGFEFGDGHHPGPTTGQEPGVSAKIGNPVTHVLCPTDFSTLSRHAERLALEVGVKFEAHLTLLHVIDVRWLDLGHLIPLPDMHEDARRRLHREATGLRDVSQLNGLSLEVAEGAPDRVILEKARAVGADLIVMGTHGRSSMERLLLGSVMERVLHTARVPLLVVPSLRSSREPALPREAFRKILVPIDFGISTATAVDWAVSFAEVYDAGIVALHVVPQPKRTFMGPNGCWVPPDELSYLEEKLETVRREQMEVLFQKFSRLPPEIAYSIVSGNPVEAIERAAASEDVDLVVMGAHGHGRHPIRLARLDVPEARPPRRAADPGGQSTSRLESRRAGVTAVVAASLEAARQGALEMGTVPIIGLSKSLMDPAFVARGSKRSL